MDTPNLSSALVLDPDLNLARSTLLSAVEAPVAISFVGSVLAVTVTVSPYSVRLVPFF